MKKRRTGIAAGLLALLLVSLSPYGFAEGMEKPASAQLVEGNTRFAMDLIRKLGEKEGNLFFSPYSLSTCLAMTYAGAGGETERQMAEVAHFALPQKDLASAFSRLEAALQAVLEKGKVGWNEANALFPQKDYPFLPEYVNGVRTHYGAAVVPVDFRERLEEGRETINGWVNNETRGKITNLIEPGILDGLTRLVLVNAVWFKGDWDLQFNREWTKKQPFYLPGGASKPVPLMGQRATVGYGETGDLQIVSLPYAGKDISMVVLLPKSRGGLPMVEKALTAKNLRDWLGLLKPRNTLVYLPRLKMTCSLSLAETLASMGMTDAFNENKADFSGMDGRKNWLFIKAVIHKAHVEVNEEGTEAAASTAVVVKAKGGPVLPVFRGDHPFLFLIMDNHSGSILFMGRVWDPPVD